MYFGCNTSNRDTDEISDALDPNPSKHWIRDSHLLGDELDEVDMLECRH